jgi:hypothetical protein
MEIPTARLVYYSPGVNNLVLQNRMSKAEYPEFAVMLESN